MDLSGLVFREWQALPDTSLTALTDRVLGCGIYVLVFENGDEYVGQSVSFTRRLTDHRRRWTDIVTIRFAAAPLDELDALERAVIRQRLSAGVRLRNIKEVNQPLHPSALDLVIDRQRQAEWLDVRAEAGASVIDTERTRLAQRRLASRKKFDALAAHPHAEMVITSVAAYVKEVIPDADVTEGRLWVLTSMPSTAKSRTNRRLVTLSIQNVEMLFLGETRSGTDWLPYTALNTAVMPEPPAELRASTFTHGHYRSAGPVHSIRMSRHDALPDLLAHPVVRHAARVLALSQLRKGRAAFSRFHNDTFADAVFARLAA